MADDYADCAGNDCEATLGSVVSRYPTRQKRRPPTSVQFNRLFFSDNPHDRLKGLHLDRIHSSPNIFLIHDFLSQKQVVFFREVIDNQGFSLSFTEGPDGKRVVSKERTSMFKSLPKGFHFAVENRAADIAGVPWVNIEPMQIVSYTKGQYFNVHHDAGDYDEESGRVTLAEPCRIATIFVYLNDLPDGIGRTVFPKLTNVLNEPLSVQPRAGMAVMFPNITEKCEADPCTIHFADAVPSGNEKYGANIWLTDRPQSMLSVSNQKGRKQTKRIEKRGQKNTKKKTKRKGFLSA